MVKRKDDGTQSGSDDKAHTETNEGKPGGSVHPSGHPEGNRIQNPAGGDESRAAPVADGFAEGRAADDAHDTGRGRGAGKTLAGVSLFATSSATTASAASTQGDDTISDGPSGNVILGLGGDDTISGNDGNDTILGGAGDDSILGGPGTDLLFGDAGNDTILGGPGTDVISGGAGNDNLEGGTGNDTIRGDQGNDTIDGGAGSDLLEGGNGDDTFVNSTSGDTIDGGNGTDTLSLTGRDPFDINVTSENPATGSQDGTIDFLDTDGNVTGSITFSNIENIVPCFTPGTRIATPRGERMVEELRVGDRVITRDNGLQEIRWIGHRALSGSELRDAPHLRPVMIRAGALGHGLPLHDMMVSPQHRMLLNSERAALYFEDREVLASARHLTGMDGVDRAPARETTYIHFMFDQHEVVLSNGAWSESFQPGEQVLDGLGDAQRDEIFELFPELRDTRGIEGYQAARRSLKKHEARLLVE